MVDLAKTNIELEKRNIPKDLKAIIKNFITDYIYAIKMQGRDIAKYETLLNQYIEFIEQQVHSPYQFTLFHQKMTTPVDYYYFGLEIFRPLIIFHESTFVGQDKVDQIISQVKKGENIILFANHQTEPDPQALSLLIDKTYPKFAEEMIFVAGHRVTTDPLAIPLSMGRNLLCIYSKKRIQNHPEKREKMLKHNQRTMHFLAKLLHEGGKCIYIAPSGGRDRPDANGIIDVAPFDSRSIEMMRLMSLKSHKKTHFYPLALSTYPMLPPPNSLHTSLSEERKTKCTPIHIAFGNEIDLDAIPISENVCKHKARDYRAKYIWQTVRNLYRALPSLT